MELGFQPPPKVQYDWPDRESMSFLGPLLKVLGCCIEKQGRLLFCLLDFVCPDLDDRKECLCSL